MFETYLGNLSNFIKFIVADYRKYWFHCTAPDCGHPFDISIAAITSKAKMCWCRYCKHKDICNIEKGCIICHAKSFAMDARAAFWDYAKNWNFEKNIGYYPCEFYPSSNKEVYFICTDPDCGHTFKQQLYLVTSQNCWCNFCASRVFCTPDKNCKICFNKSFATHEKAADWDYDKNDCAPCEVARCSDDKYYFICSEKDCGHPLYRNISGITCDGKWCKFCTNKERCPAKDNCKSCYNRSFATHRRAKHWNYELNKLEPCEVAIKNNNKFWFNCPNKKCKHQFKQRILGIVNRNIWCGFCGNRQLCPEEKNCIICYAKSAASHKLMRTSWAPSNEKPACEIFLNDNDKYDFICSTCPVGDNKFKISPGSANCGSWCGKCKRKTETKMRNFLLTTDFSLDDTRVEWCRNIYTNRYLPYDFLSDILKIIIELDGPQHFRQISNWGSHSQIQIRDTRKMHCAFAQGYTVIHILQEDVWNNRNEWKTKILTAINMKYDSPQWIYIASDMSLYNPLRQKLIDTKKSFKVSTRMASSAAVSSGSKRRN